MSAWQQSPDFRDDLGEDRKIPSHGLLQLSNDFSLALVIQADENPVVDPEGSKKLYDKLGSAKKEFCLLNYDRHVLVNGTEAENVHQKIATFLNHLKLGRKKS